MIAATRGQAQSCRRRNFPVNFTAEDVPKARLKRVLARPNAESERLPMEVRDAELWGSILFMIYFRPFIWSSNEVCGQAGVHLTSGQSSPFSLRFVSARAARSLSDGSG